MRNPHIAASATRANTIVFCMNRFRVNLTHHNG